MIQIKKNIREEVRLIMGNSKMRAGGGDMVTWRIQALSNANASIVAQHHQLLLGLDAGVIGCKEF